MRILVVNVNTSESMTESIAQAASRYASPGTETVALQPYFGAEAVDCNFESYLAAGAGIDRGGTFEPTLYAGATGGVRRAGAARLPGVSGAPGVRDTGALRVPVIHGVGAAVRLAEAVTGLGLKTSKRSTYAFPEPKKIIGWPLSESLGLRSDAAGVPSRK